MHGNEIVYNEDDDKGKDEDDDHGDDMDYSDYADFITELFNEDEDEEEFEGFPSDEDD